MAERFYVSNSGPQMYVKAYDVGSDGTPTNGRMLIEYRGHGGGPGIPDELKVDMNGNIWSTYGPGGIRIILSAGQGPRPDQTA